MPNGAITQNLSFLIANRGGFNYKPNLTSDKPVQWTLESVRDRLARQAKYENAKFSTTDLNQLQVIVENGTLCLRRRAGIQDGKVVWSQALPLHEDAWSQLYSMTVTGIKPASAGIMGVKPKGRDGMGVVNTLVQSLNSNDPVSVAAAQTALAFVNMLLMSAGAKSVNLHHKNRRINNVDFRFICAITSTTYVRLSHDEYVTSLLDVPEFRDKAVVDFRTDDRRLYLRTLLDDVQDGIQTRVQYRTFDGWNGETGHRSYGGADGLFQYECLNGMGNYAQAERFSWAHVGSASPGDRIRGQLGVILERGSRAQAAMQAAQLREITDAMSVMEGILNGNGFGDNAIKGVRNAMLESSNVLETSEFNTLANIIDGMTLHAQEYATIDARESMERLAYKTLMTF